MIRAELLEEVREERERMNENFLRYEMKLKDTGNYRSTGLSFEFSTLKR